MKTTLNNAGAFPWHSGHRYRLACQRPGYDLAWAHNINFVKSEKFIWNMEIRAKKKMTINISEKKEYNSKKRIQYENSTET